MINSILILPCSQERITKSTMDLTDSADATEIFLNQNRDMFAMVCEYEGLILES